MRNLRSARPIVHKKVLHLMENFLKYKRSWGSPIEKDLYKYMTLPEFVDRLMRKRAAMFTGEDNPGMLRDGYKITNGWESIGTENEKIPLVLSDYLSCDEMKISAFLSVSSLTIFLNDGSRNNCGSVFDPKKGKHQSDGVIIGVAGPCIEKEDKMDFQDVIITPSQNHPSNAYGKPEYCGTFRNAEKLKLFSELHGVSYFPSFEEVQTESKWNAEVDKIGDVYCWKSLLKKRIQLDVETILLVAEQQGKLNFRQVYVRVPGFVLSRSLIETRNFARKYFLEAFRDAMENLKLKYVSDVSFMSIPEELSPFKNGKGPNGVHVHFSDERPHDPLTGAHQDKLLVSVYQCNGNALPVNEFWDRRFNASGGSAAACSTQIAESHNPCYSPYLKGNNLLVACPDTCKLTPFKWMVKDLPFQTRRR